MTRTIADTEYKADLIILRLAGRGKTLAEIGVHPSVRLSPSGVCRRLQRLRESHAVIVSRGEKPSPEN